jgi:alkanesulfonate monooxygenase SsuD/methylene tetrahydromethanopterin reductase-like flavin-dependent oxidoreductase (luciferase family)
LGVALGWNTVEYQALGKDFRTRGRRIDDQIALLRQLWTQSSVTFERGDEHVVGAGINPPPIQRPIPIWLGGMSPAAYRRIGRLADGWFPRVGVGPELDEARATIAAAAREAGRDPAAIRMESQLEWTGDPDGIADQAARWRRAGATHTAVNTMRADLAKVDDHIRALAAAAGALGLHA